MAVVVLELPGDDEDEYAGCSCPRCQPSLAQVKAQRPTPFQVTQVAALFGAWPPGSYLSGDIVVGERP